MPLYIVTGFSSSILIVVTCIHPSTVMDVLMCISQCSKHRYILYTVPDDSHQVTACHTSCLDLAVVSEMYWPVYIAGSVGLNSLCELAVLGKPA